MSNHSSAVTPVRPIWTITDRLRKARESANFTQAELALRAQLDRKTVSNYEQGRTSPTMQVLAKWAGATDVDFEWLAGDHLAPAELAAGKVLIAMAHEYIYTRAVDHSDAASAA